MAGSHVLRAPGTGVHRVSRSIDVFAFHTPQPLARPVADPIEDGNRWDDAEGKFATVYCASRADRIRRGDSPLPRTARAA
jgi:hypothetical protein